MPGIYKPLIEFFPTGIVTITSVDNTTYDEIQASLGSVVYFLRTCYLKTQTREQLMQPIFFQKYDANGNKQKFSEIISIDPNQMQNSLNLELEKHKVVFDGQAFPTVNILPWQTVNLYFSVEKSSGKIDYLTEKTIFSTNDFFKKFSDQIDYES